MRTVRLGVVQRVNWVEAPEWIDYYVDDDDEYSYHDIHEAVKRRLALYAHLPDGHEEKVKVADEAARFLSDVRAVWLSIPGAISSDMRVIRKEITE